MHLWFQEANKMDGKKKLKRLKRANRSVYIQLVTRDHAQSFAGDTCGSLRVLWFSAVEHILILKINYETFIRTDWIELRLGWDSEV